MNKKKSERLHTLYVAVVGVLLVLAGVFTLVHATAAYTSGFHNVDFCANIGWLELKLNITGVDVNSEGQVWSWQECYIDGMNKIEAFPVNSAQSYILIIIGVAAIFSSIVGE